MENIKLKNELIQVINDKGILNISEFNHSNPAERYLISLFSILRTINSRKVNEFLFDFQYLIKQKNIPVFKYEKVTYLYKAWLTTPHVCNSLIYFTKKVGIEINSEEVWNVLISKSLSMKETTMKHHCFLLTLFFKNKIILNQDVADNIPLIKSIFELRIDNDMLIGPNNKVEKMLEKKFHFILFWSGLVAEKVTHNPSHKCALIKSIFQREYPESFNASFYDFIRALTDRVNIDYIFYHTLIDLNKLHQIFRIDPSIFERAIPLKEVDASTSVLCHFFSDYKVSGLFLRNFYQLNKMEEDWFFHLLKGKGMHTTKNLPLPLTKKAAHIFRQFGVEENISIKKGFVLASFISLGVSKEFGYDATKSIRNMEHSQFWVATLSNFYKKGLVSSDLPLVVDYINNQVFNLKKNINWKHKTVNNLLKDAEQWHADLFHQEQLIKEKKILARNLHFKKSSISNFSIESIAFNESIEKYTIKQIKSSNELYAEGRQLSHCVYSYRNLCKSNSVQIFSLSIIGENNMSKPQITLELRDKDICQARGAYNRYPYDNELEIIKLWAKKEGLVFHF